eukprot:gene2950-3392_t
MATHKMSYDYLVIGAGSAGSIVANKLSESNTNSVLLVEEGGYATNKWIWDSHDWALHFVLGDQKDVSKIFHSTPQEHAGDRQMKLIRAKVTGGCHAINGMVVAFGSDYDYDAWANVTGEPQWSWSHMAPHIQDLKDHINFRFMDGNRKLMPEIRKAVESTGFKYVADPIGTGKPFGYANHRLSMGPKPGNPTQYQRQTTFSRYIDPISKTRSNLDVIVYHKAVWIEFEDDPITHLKRAKAVYLLNTQNNEITYIMVGKELVLSMGAYDSPLLLQFSGVGDPAHLRSLGIPVVINSPYVGKNLQDHMYLHMVGRPLNPLIALGVTNEDLRAELPIDGWQSFGPQDSVDKKVRWITIPDIKPIPILNIITFQCTIEMVDPHPLSAGKIQIRELEEGNLTFIQPDVETNFLSQQHDLDNFKTALKYCRDVQDHLIGQGIINGIAPDIMPNNLLVNTDATIEEYIRNNANADYHPHASCRMGADSDITSPLNNRLVLKGTTNLRVLDASSIPIAPSGNTNFPTMIIALQGSKFILEDNQPKQTNV